MAAIQRSNETVPDWATPTYVIVHHTCPREESHNTHNNSSLGSYAKVIHNLIYITDKGCQQTTKVF